jgi:thiamine-phosphate pyrophosphorylase
MLRYAITPGSPGGTSRSNKRESIVDHAMRCAATQVDFFQLREKQLDAGELAEIAREVLRVVRPQNSGPTRLLINSRADVAIAVGADGVHLTSAQGELTPEQVRALYAAAQLPSPVISISCHSLPEIARARGLGTSLILFGPVFGKSVQSPQSGEVKVVSPALGLGHLRQACTLADPIPVLALGGVTEANAPECIRAGAAGVASIRLFANEGCSIARNRSLPLSRR